MAYYYSAVRNAMPSFGVRSLFGRLVNTLKRMAPDLLAIGFVGVLPLLVFWAFWAPSPPTSAPIATPACPNGTVSTDCRIVSMP